MKYGKFEQVDFLKTVIYDYQRKIDQETDKEKLWILNDILDMYYCILESTEKR